MRTQSESQTDGDISLLQDRSWLQEHYIEQQLSAPEVADKAGVSKSAVYTWLDQHGIETRSMSEAKADGDTEPLQDPEWLREQYHDGEQSTYDIAAECGVTRPTVCNWMRRHGIQFRDQTDGDVEQLLDGEWLREQYCEQDRPTTAIADELGLDHRTVRKYMDKHGIDRKYRGKHHHMWKGGGVEYYGPSWPQQRAKTLRRDDFECQNCGIGRDDHYEKFDLDLNVHHVQPFRTFDSAAIANQLDNLVTLCHSCHLKIERTNEVSEQ
ncbi:HNH endonuclease [Natrinema pallidum]|nr:HNH endonuclease [Natrinema pallidum]